MRQPIKLILLSLSFVLLAACQNTEVTTDPTPTQPENRLSTSDFATAKTLFEDNCQGCHVSAPVGPAFKGHLPTFTKVTNGQTYLINALLFGLEGAITVGGQNFDGVMANRSSDFSDTEIALILNYGLTGLGDNSSLLTDDFKLITAAEVATERQTQKTMSDVFALRNALNLP